MVKNKGQMKIQQTAFMIVALTLFFALVGLFFVSLNLNQLKGDANSLKEKQAKLLVSRLANSPEFACGSSFGSKLGDCVDADKVLMLMQNIDRYENFWGVDDIKIRILYPEHISDSVCRISNFPDCNIINLIKQDVVGTYRSNFISLCRKEKQESNNYNKCDLAVLMVSYENVK